MHTTNIRHVFYVLDHQLSLFTFGDKGQHSQSSILLQFFKKCQTAQMALPFSILPQDQQMVRRTCDQTIFPEAQKHLEEWKLFSLSLVVDWYYVGESALFLHDYIIPGLHPSVQSGHLSAPVSWCWGLLSPFLSEAQSVCLSDWKSTCQRSLRWERQCFWKYFHSNIKYKCA